MHRAALVIEHGSTWPGRHLVLKCVEFAQEAISGLSLLELAGVNSGAPPQVFDWGGGAVTICQVDREPTVVPSRCFGPTSGPNWSDWALSASGWRARSSGTGGYSLHDGDVEGWTYAGGFGAPPPTTSFAAICPPAAAATSATHATAPSVPASSRAQAVAPTAGPTSTAPPTPAASPTASPSAARPQLLAHTGPATGAAGFPSPVWFLFGGSTAVLAGLAAINLRRRGP